MTYLNTAAPAQRALRLQNYVGAATRTVADFLVRFGRAISISSVAHQRLSQVERLQSKSDAELAEMGLRREDIVRHIFHDVFRY